MVTGQVPVPAGSGGFQWSKACPSTALTSTSGRACPAHIPPVVPTILSGTDKGLGGEWGLGEA